MVYGLELLFRSGPKLSFEERERKRRVGKKGGVAVESDSSSLSKLRGSSAFTNPRGSESYTQNPTGRIPILPILSILQPEAGVHFIPDNQEVWYRLNYTARYSSNVYSSC